jgi:hypothetical protein
LFDSHNAVITEKLQESNHRNYRRLWGPPRLHQMTSSLQQLHLTLDTCKHRESCSESCHTYALFLSLLSTHTLIVHKATFKRVTR